MRLLTARVTAGTIALLLGASGSGIAQQPPPSPSNAGMGYLGREVQAGNRDCPPLGSGERVVNPVATPGAVSCAPTGAGPGGGYSSPVPPAVPDAGKVTPSGPSGASPWAPQNR